MAVSAMEAANEGREWSCELTFHFSFSRKLQVVVADVVTGL